MHEWTRKSLEIQMLELQIDALYAERAKLRQEQKLLYQAIRSEAGQTGKTFEQIIEREG